MNLGSIIKGVLGLFTGGLSKDDYNGNPNNDPESYTDFGGSLDNLGAKITGSRLTNADKEANAWTAQREDIAWQRQMEASNTAYQRQVSDLSAAGLNPMLAVGSGNGASVPSASTSGSVAPSSTGFNLGSLLSAMIQSRVAKADIELKDAQASKLRSETEGQDIANSIAKLTKDAEVEYRNMKADLSRTQMNEANKRIDEMDSHIAKMAEEAQSEESKRQANQARAILDNMNAYSALAMLPYEQAYKSAQTQNEKQAALLAAAHAAYQHKLIDDGYIDALISREKAEAGSAEAKQELDVLKAAIRSGDYSKVHHQYSLSGDIMSTFAILLDNFNPLNGIFK